MPGNPQLNDDQAKIEPIGRLPAIKKLGQRAVIYGSGQAASRLISLLILPVSTAYLSRSDFGTLAILVFSGLLLRTLLSIGISQALGIIYFDKDNSEHKSKVIQNAFLALCALSIVGLLALLLAWWTTTSFGLFLKISFVVISLQVVASTLQLVTEPLMLKLQFDERPGAFVLVGLGSGALGASISVALLIFAGMGLVGILIGNLVGSIVSLFSAIWAAKLVQTYSIDRTYINKLIRLGLPFVPAALMSLAMLNAAPVLLAHFASLEEAGLYAVGFQFGSAMGLLVGSITAAWYPFFMSYKTRQREASLLFPSLSLAYTVGLGIVTLLFFIAAWPGVRLFVAEPFWNSYRIIGIIAASQALLGLWSFLLPALYYSEETKLILIPHFVAGLTTLAVQIVLIPEFGAEGAALGVLAGTCVLSVVQLILNSTKGYELRMFMVRRGVTILVGIGSFAILQRVIDHHSSGINWVILSICSVLVCAMLIAIVVPRQIRDRIQSLIKDNSSSEISQ